MLDPGAVRRAVLDARPGAIIHQATALAGMRFSRSLDRAFAPTNRLRTEGTDALLAAAREAGVRRFVARSFASYRYAREGGPVRTEGLPGRAGGAGGSGRAIAQAGNVPGVHGEAIPAGRADLAGHLSEAEPWPQGAPAERRAQWPAIWPPSMCRISPVMYGDDSR